jgi:hypothetical protein
MRVSIANLCDMPNLTAEAERTMAAAAAKAPADPMEFLPYVRAAIVYWRSREEESRLADEATAYLEATTERIICEDQFRSIAGRSFHLTDDHISFADVAALPEA